MAATSSEIRDKIYQFVNKFCPEGPREIHSSDRIIDDLGYHSVKVVELMLALEEEYSISPPLSEDDTAGLETVDDIVSLIARRINAHS